VEAGIFRVDNALHCRLEDAVRSIREPAAGGRPLPTSKLTPSSIRLRRPRGKPGRRGLRPVTDVTLVGIEIPGGSGLDPEGFAHCHIKR